jgi:hypothetical protein
MSASMVDIPPSDAWVIARLSQIFAKRLVAGNDTAAQRQTLMRALFGLQRLPILIRDLHVVISAGRSRFDINSDYCGFVCYTEDWHTEFRIQYFVGSSHCIEMNDLLEGADRIAAATLRLDDFAASMDEMDELFVEDYSTPVTADEPPISHQHKRALTHDIPPVSGSPAP